MTTPDGTTETSDLDTAAHTPETAAGAHVAAPISDAKTPWWKRLLGRG